MKNLTAFLFVAILILTGISTAEAQAIKWHPGHYVMLGGGDSQSQHFSNIDEIAREPAIEGVQVRIWWHDLEKSKGDYDFSRIDAYLKKLKSLSTTKRLVLRVMDRRFGTASRARIVPDYLLSDSQYNGGVARTKNGYAARLWEKPVMDRLIALYQALGSRYDADSYFEGIATTETTLGFKTKPGGYSVSALAQQYHRFIDEARKNMPHTNLFFYTNWLSTNEVMGDVIQALVEPAIGVGGPNTVPGKPTHGQTVWTGQAGADFRGLLAISSGVETGELGGNNGDFTPKQIYDYAYGTLRVNYMFWVRNGWSGDANQKWSTGILPFLRTNPPVRTTCPTSYGMCATQ